MRREGEREGEKKRKRERERDREREVGERGRERKRGERDAAKCDMKWHSSIICKKMRRKKSSKIIG